MNEKKNDTLVALSLVVLFVVILGVILALILSFAGPYPVEGAFL